MHKGRQIIAEAKKLISDADFQLRHKILNANFIRKRKLPFEKIFVMILKLVKKSLLIECELLGIKVTDMPPSKQAFSKARYKISHTGFKELMNSGINNFYNDHKYGTWKEYRVIAADGSSLRLPDSEEVVNKFGVFKPNGTSGKMSPISRISLFVDLCTSFIINARIERWDIGEQTMAQEQLPEVVTKMRELKHKKLLFIYDRGYPSLSFMKQHQDLEVDFIFRLQRGMYKELWKRVDAGEEDFNILIKNKKPFATYNIRVVAIKLPSGIVEVLGTSLYDRNKFSINNLSNAYKLRWQIEECYKRLKIGAELENFSGKKVEAILQEFWSHITMCNILSAYMCEEQGCWNIDNLPKYRLNFCFLFGAMREKIRSVLMGELSLNSFNNFFLRAASRAKIKVRPGRLYSRAKVKIPKRHHVFRRVC